MPEHWHQNFSLKFRVLKPVGVNISVNPDIVAKIFPERIWENPSNQWDDMRQGNYMLPLAMENVLQFEVWEIPIVLISIL